VLKDFIVDENEFKKYNRDIAIDELLK